jgi:hypothetical protein
MRFAVVITLSILFVGCDPVPKQTAAEQAELTVETNEALAVSNLRSMVSAETKAKALCVVDVDDDGWGEFLFLNELAGARAPRGPGRGLPIPLLPDAFKHRGAGGFVEVHGYLYRLFLIDAGGTPLDDGAADPTQAEVKWSCYAWPVEYGRSGRLSFYADETGVVRAEEAPGLSGAHAPEAAATLVRGDDGKQPAWSPCE